MRKITVRMDEVAVRNVLTCIQKVWEHGEVRSEAASDELKRVRMTLEIALQQKPKMERGK